MAKRFNILQYAGITDLWAPFTGCLRAIRILLLSALVTVLGITACTKDPVSTPNDEPVVGSWLIWSPLDWAHDGKPVRSDYCIVFSDGASQELKLRVGQYADQKFMEVINRFSFDQMNDLRYPPGHSKIDIYINRNHPESIAAAWWGSVFLTMRSDDIDLNRYNYLFKHELTHAFEFLIEGQVNLGTDVWFREGIAVYIGGVEAIGLGKVDTEAELDAWLDKNRDAPNLGNPVSIHQWDDFPESADITHYYVLFELAVRYLLESSENQNSLTDIVDLFYSLRSGAEFSGALQTNLNTSLYTYETRFYDLIRIYLRSLEN